MKRSFTAISIGIVFTVGAAWGDVTVKSTYRTGGDTATYVAYLTNQRQRFEYGATVKVIRRIDQPRVIEIDDEARSWVAIPMDPPKPAAERKGGLVTVATTVVDTHETKTMFGLPARHLKKTVVTSSSAGACQPGRETVETDGWYVDIEYPEAAPESSTPGCKDEIRYETNGAAKTGYPVAYTTRIVDAQGKETTVSLEVTELSTAAIPESVFEPPSDYTERKNTADLAAARPKPAGVLRVGVVTLTDASGQQIPVAPLNSRLAALLTNKDVQGVPLGSAADAASAHCDFVLETEVASVSKSAVGQVAGRVMKLGGMLSRGGAKAPAQDGMQATLRFNLIRPGEKDAVLSSSAAGKNGSALNLKTALQLASFATPMGLLIHSMGGQGLGMFASQWMRGSAFGATDPALSMMFRGITPASQAAEPASSETSAVVAALENEAQAVMARLKTGS